MMMKSRTFQILGLVIAGLCLFRVLSVAAAERDVETYSATEASDNSDSDSSDDNDGDGGQAEIRLSSPDEAAAHIADDDSPEDLVPGVERLRAREQAENTIIVPKRMGRTISPGTSGRGRALASAPEGADRLVTSEPVSPIGVRPEAVSAGPTQGRLSAAPLDSGVMEPSRDRPFTSADARARGSELRQESIAATGVRSSSPAYGIRSEPPLETRIAPPVPESAKAAFAGVQEISLIVSDYGYFPNRIFVTQGVPVKIYLTTPSKVTMCFMQDNWSVRKGVGPGKIEEVSFVPDQPGNFRFYCPVKSIEGTITVREPVVDEPQGRAVASVPEEPKLGHSNEPKRAAELRSLIED